MPVEPKVLQTQTVPLNEVMANLPEWVDAPRAEYTSLTEGTNATKPVHKDTLRHRTDVEYAPGKLVATLKPGNKKKARLAVCGNRVEVSDDNQVDQDGSSEYANKGRKTYDTYAGGIRCMCASSAEESWGAPVELCIHRCAHGLSACPAPWNWNTGGQTAKGAYSLWVDPSNRDVRSQQSVVWTSVITARLGCVLRL